MNNDLLKKLIELMPKEDNGINEETGMKNYLPFNKGIVTGWNECRQSCISSLPAVIEEYNKWLIREIEKMTWETYEETFINPNNKRVIWKNLY